MGRGETSDRGGDGETLIVYLTAGSAEEAGRLADALVNERLAACVNVLPHIRSVYRWRGGVERAEESALIAKTRADRFDALCARVRALHSYETPCIVAWPITRGFSPFLRWVSEECVAGTSDPPAENKH
jgi:periplasmic divalent cation tolerance protein